MRIAYTAILTDAGESLASARIAFLLDERELGRKIGPRVIDCQ